jgi:hypothetical protein
MLAISTTANSENNLLDIFFLLFLIGVSEISDGVGCQIGFAMGDNLASK